MFGVFFYWRCNKVILFKFIDNIGFDMEVSFYISFRVREVRYNKFSNKFVSEWICFKVF